MIAIQFPVSLTACPTSNGVKPRTRNTRIAAR
jgi:hypothetical protein